MMNHDLSSYKIDWYSLLYFNENTNNSSIYVSTYMLHIIYYLLSPSKDVIWYDKNTNYELSIPIQLKQNCMLEKSHPH